MAGMLFLLFLGLELGHVIDWPWYAVAAPLLIPIGIALLAIFGVIVGAVRATK